MSSNASTSNVSTVGTAHVQPGNASRRASSAPHGVYSSFEPSHLELKGFCAWEDRHKKGITRSETQMMMDKLNAMLPVQVKKAVGEFRFGEYETSALRFLWKTLTSMKFWESGVSTSKKTGLFITAGNYGFMPKDLPLRSNALPNFVNARNMRR